MNPVGLSEIRVVIQPASARDAPTGPVPALVFKKVFDAVLAALIAADREIHTKNSASEFVVAYLAVGTCEFGFAEKMQAVGPRAASAIDLFRRCAGRVYRSDYQILMQYPRLMRAFHRLALALDPAYAVVVRHADAELPLDAFFRRQVDRVGLSDPRPIGDIWFAGSVIGAFDGRLEALDYRGALWKGRLTLAGSETQVDCVFDRRRGEDALNPFGNKDVSIAGRAIYTGDSQLPERVEVIDIQERPRATAAIDIRGALDPVAVGDWDDGLDHLHKR
jgi:hypothetical protein